MREMQERGERKGSVLQYLIVVVLVGAGFWTGTLYQQVKNFRQGSVQAQVAGAQADDSAPTPQVQEPVVLEGADWEEVVKNPVAELGSDKAKVTLVEFTDYQCPFCKRSFETTWPQIKKDYVDTGKVRVVMRDLPLSFHPNAKPGALAARCAGDQGKYWEMHDKLFTSQDEWTPLGDASDKIKEYAKDLGLNTANFNSCFDDKKYDKQIDAEVTLANKVGATGTPTFFVNGKQIVGAQPIGTFTAAIEGELSK